MIFQGLFYLIMGLLGLFASYLPGYGQVPLLLPWGVDGILSSIVSFYRGAMETLPYLRAGLNAFLIILAFEIGMLILKLFLGSRTPLTQHGN